MKIEEFNQSQKEAIAHEKNPMLVLAGPGSGKTTVVVHRAKRLIEECDIAPSSILVITFTKSAAQEMKGRFLDLSVVGGEGVSFGTIHSLCFRILRRETGESVNKIITEEEKWGVMRQILQNLQLEINDEEEYIKKFQSEYSKMKNELIEAYLYQPIDTPKDEFRIMCRDYEEAKIRLDKIDFDDMLTIAYEYLKDKKEVLAFWQKKYKYILVDEFQDINKVQYECIKLLAMPENNLFVVGDDDQSIYQFRGAKPEFLLQFPNEFLDVKTVKLDVNYRSTDRIIRLASKIISNNQMRFKKEQSGINGEGSKIIYFSTEDVMMECSKIGDKIVELKLMGIPYEEMAIIFRTNMQAGQFTRIFINRGIPYRLKDTGANIYTHWVVNDILAYMRLALDESDDQSFMRIVNKPKRYMSKDILSEAGKLQYHLLKSLYLCPELKKWQSEQIQTLQQHLAILKNKNPYEAIKYIRTVIGYDEYLKEYALYRKANLEGLKDIADEIQEMGKEFETFTDFSAKVLELSIEMKNKSRIKEELQKGVTLSTMHSAKGLEFEAVFIPSLLEGFVPHKKSETEEEMEEERRLFYVAVTRAKDRLYLSRSKKKHEKDCKPSRFLKEIGLKIKD